MCQKLIIDRGEKELQTVKEWKEHFKVGLLIPENATDVVDEDCCLCQVDIAAELINMGIPFAWDYCDYYIGEGVEEIQKEYS